MSSAGFDVVVLEQGQWTDPALLPGNKPAYEIAGATHWHPDPNVRGKTADYPVDTSQSDLPVWLYNGVGGSSVLYGGPGPDLCHQILLSGPLTASPTTGR